MQLLLSVPAKGFFRPPSRRSGTFQHLRSLHFELLFVGNVLPGTPTAQLEVRAVRWHGVRRINHGGEFRGFREPASFLDRGYFRQNRLPGRGALAKHHEPFRQTTNPFSPESETHALQLDLVPNEEGGGWGDRGG